MNYFGSGGNPNFSFKLGMSWNALELHSVLLCAYLALSLLVIRIEYDVFHIIFFHVINERNLDWVYFQNIVHFNFLRLQINWNFKMVRGTIMETIGGTRDGLLNKMHGLVMNLLFTEYFARMRSLEVLLARAGKW